MYIYIYITCIHILYICVNICIYIMYIYVPLNSYSSKGFKICSNYMSFRII